MRFARMLPVLFLLFASQAMASGVGLSVNACPGNPGASTDAGTLDCAGGQQLTMLLTFASSVAISSMTGVEFEITAIVDGDLSAGAAFWDFDGVNHAGWHADRSRPAAGCANYTDAWTGPGTSVLWGGSSHEGSVLRLEVACSRSTELAIAAEQPIFGAQVVFDGAQSVEAGGTLPGCPLGICFAVPYAAIYGHAARLPVVSGLGAMSEFPNILTVNGTPQSGCLTVPARRHTWGQLKTLYR
jgi:hypothetical protein